MYLDTSSPTIQFALVRIAIATFSCFDYEVLQVFDPLFGWEGREAGSKRASVVARQIVQLGGNSVKCDSSSMYAM